MLIATLWKVKSTPHKGTSGPIKFCFPLPLKLYSMGKWCKATNVQTNLHRFAENFLASKDLVTEFKLLVTNSWKPPKGRDQKKENSPLNVNQSDSEGIFYFFKKSPLPPPPAAPTAAILGVRFLPSRWLAQRGRWFRPLVEWCHFEVNYKLPRFSALINEIQLEMGPK